MPDDTDRLILRHLLANPAGRTSTIAERCGLSPAVVARRLERLKTKGILRGQLAEINWTALGYAVKVSLRFTLDKTHARAFDEFLTAARKVPEVTEIQTFLGRVDVRLAIIARNMEHYQIIYRARVLTLPHIADIEALMHIATIKTTPSLPI